MLTSKRGTLNLFLLRCSLRMSFSVAVAVKVDALISVAAAPEVTNCRSEHLSWNHRARQWREWNLGDNSSDSHSLFYSALVNPACCLVWKIVIKHQQGRQSDDAWKIWLSECILSEWSKCINGDQSCCPSIDNEHSPATNQLRKSCTKNCRRMSRIKEFSTYSVIDCDAPRDELNLF